MLFRIIKQVISELKVQSQINKDMRRLVKSELDYGALQRMVDNVVTSNVEFEIKMADKTITIKPQGRPQGNNSFYTAYMKSR